MPVRSSHLVLLCLASAGIAWGSGSQPGRELRASSAAPTLAPALTRQQKWFDARGRYYPTQDVMVKGRHFDYLALSVHYASLELGPLSGDTETVSIDCGRSTITPDTLRVSCAGDAIGTLTMTGAFLDKKGDFANRPEITGDKVILEATVTYKGPSGMQSVPVQFTWGLLTGL